MTEIFQKSYIVIQLCSFLGINNISWKVKGKVDLVTLQFYFNKEKSISMMCIVEIQANTSIE